MVVAIQRGLEGIKSKLTQKGYNTVYYDEYSHPIDIYIYIGHTLDSSYSGYMNTSPVSGVTNINHGHESRSTGVLHINANYKSLREIEYLINTKRASHNLH